MIDVVLLKWRRRFELNRNKNVQSALQSELCDQLLNTSTQNFSIHFLLQMSVDNQELIIKILPQKNDYN